VVETVVEAAPAPAEAQISTSESETQIASSEAQETTPQVDETPIPTQTQEKAKEEEPAAVKIPAMHSGYLTKQGHFVRSWKRRYFVLDGGMLKYFGKAIDGRLRCISYVHLMLRCYLWLVVALHST
jgi:hypothetical protein